MQGCGCDGPLQFFEGECPQPGLGANSRMLRSRSPGARYFGQQVGIREWISGHN